MEDILSIVSWRLPMSIFPGSASTSSALQMAVMIGLACFGAGLVSRLTGISSRLTGLMSFAVMLIGAAGANLVAERFAVAMYLPVENPVVASALMANVGMVFSGCALMWCYRNSV